MAKFWVTTSDVKWLNMKMRIKKRKKALRKEQKDLQEKGKLLRKGQENRRRKSNLTTGESQLLLKDLAVQHDMAKKTPIKQHRLKLESNKTSFANRLFATSKLPKEMPRKRLRMS